MLYLSLCAHTADLAFYRREGSLSQMPLPPPHPGGGGLGASASGSGGSSTSQLGGASLWGLQQLQQERERRRDVAWELEAGVKELEVSGGVVV